jgi:plastocyanin
VGQPLAAALSVVVTEDGTPNAGETVAWSTTAAGGSVDPASAATDASGIASTAWTLGTVSGAQTATATLTGATGSPVTFTATANADAATTLAKAGGDNQTGEIGAQLAAAVQAKVSDQFGNGVQGVSVDWAATDATVSAPSVPSNAAGISAVTVTLGGTAGPITITATSGSLTGSPLTFAAEAVQPTPPPTTAAVTVGNIFFRSSRNSTSPAVDTVAVGGTVTWTWVATGAEPHSVRSTGSPSFTSSPVLTGNGESYDFNFSTAGTYQYDCSVHGAQMTGRIVVR